MDLNGSVRCIHNIFLLCIGDRICIEFHSPTYLSHYPHKLVSRVQVLTAIRTIVSMPNILNRRGYRSSAYLGYYCSVPKPESDPRSYPDPRIRGSPRLRPARPRRPSARTPGTPAVPPEGPGAVYTQSPTRRVPRFALKNHSAAGLAARAVTRPDSGPRSVSECK